MAESLPEVKQIEVARLTPTDVVVVEVQGHLSAEATARMQATLQPLWPENKILVLEDGARLKVASSAAPRCETCRFWHRLTLAGHYVTSGGTCVRPHLAGRGMIATGEIETRESFGCVQWEARA